MHCAPAVDMADLTRIGGPRHERQSMIPNWRLTLAIASSATMLWIAYRFDLHAKVLASVTQAVDQAGVWPVISLMSFLLLLAILPRKALRDTWTLFRANRVVVVAILLATTVGGITTWWVQSSARAGSPDEANSPSVADSIQSGVLVAGVIAAALGFWFNDQRRRREDDTLKNENTRLEREKRRAEDEHFIKTVELIGDDNAGVRIGALHALRSLADYSPERIPTIQSVISAYLRQPFDYPADDAAVEHDSASSKAQRDLRLEIQERMREKQVRKIAQQILIELLPVASPDESNTPQNHAPRIDVSGAHLEAFSLTGKVLNLEASDCTVHGSVLLEDCLVPNGMTFQRAQILGGLRILRSRVGYLHLTEARLRRLEINDSLVERRADIDIYSTRTLVRPSSIIIKGNSRLGPTAFAQALGTLELTDCTFTGPVTLEAQVHDRILLRHCDFGPIFVDLSLLTLPANISTLALPEIYCEDLQPPQGWELDLVRGAVPLLVRHARRGDEGAGPFGDAQAAIHLPSEEPSMRAES